MKNLIKLVSVFLILTSCSSSDEPIKPNTDNFKRYLVESGQIGYTITVSGSVLNTTFEGSGSARTYFKNWGNVELNEEESTITTTSTIPGGGTVVDTNVNHEMNKLEDLYSYSVDFKEQKIYKRKDLALEAIKNSPNYDPIKVAEQIMLQNGGTKLPNEKYMGYDCEVWSFLGSKLWGYKGVTLKIESTLAGMHTVKKAIKIQFNVAIDDSKFELPNYPIIEQDF